MLLSLQSYHLQSFRAETCDPNWAKSIGVVIYPLFLHSTTSEWSLCTSACWVGSESVCLSRRVSAAHLQLSFCGLASFVGAQLKLPEVCDNVCSRLHPSPPERQIKTWVKAYRPVWFCSADYAVPAGLRSASYWRPFHLGWQKVAVFECLSKSLSLYCTAGSSVRIPIYTYYIEEGLLKVILYSRRILQDKQAECTLCTWAQHSQPRHESRTSKHLIISIDLPDPDWHLVLQDYLLVITSD